MTVLMLKYEGCDSGYYPTYGSLYVRGELYTSFVVFPDRNPVKFFQNANRSHTVHIMITALAAIDDPRARELYNTMRVAYNSSGRPGAPPLPPLEEFQGITPCCDHFYCRCV